MILFTLLDLLYVYVLLAQPLRIFPPFYSIILRCSLFYFISHFFVVLPPLYPLPTLPLSLFPPFQPCALICTRTRRLLKSPTQNITTPTSLQYERLFYFTGMFLSLSLWFLFYVYFFTFGDLNDFDELNWYELQRIFQNEKIEWISFSLNLCGFVRMTCRTLSVMVGHGALLTWLGVHLNPLHMNWKPERLNAYSSISPTRVWVLPQTLRITIISSPIFN